MSRRSSPSPPRGTVPTRGRPSQPAADSANQRQSSQPAADSANQRQPRQPAANRANPGDAPPAERHSSTTAQEQIRPCKRRCDLHCLPQCDLQCPPNRMSRRVPNPRPRRGPPATFCSAHRARPCSNRDSTRYRLHLADQSTQTVPVVTMESIVRQKTWENSDAHRHSDQIRTTGPAARDRFELRSL